MHQIFLQTGFMGLSSGLGAIFAAFFLARLAGTIFKDLDRKSAFQASYNSVGISAIAFGLFIGFALNKKIGSKFFKFGKNNKNLNNSSKTTGTEEAALASSTALISSIDSKTAPASQKEYFWVQVWKGLLLIKDPSVALGYLGSFVVRATDINKRKTNYSNPISLNNRCCFPIIIKNIGSG